MKFHVVKDAKEDVLYIVQDFWVNLQLLRAECINWLQYYIFRGRNAIPLLSTQTGVRLIDVFNNRNKPNTIYFSVRLIEVSAE